MAVAVKSHFTAIFSSSQQEQWQCGSSLISTSSRSQQHAAVRTLQWLACSSGLQCYEIMQLGTGRIPAGSVPAGHSHDSYTRHAGSQYSLLTRQPDMSVLMPYTTSCWAQTIGPCPVHSLANYTQLSSPYIYTEFLVYQIIFEKYCYTIP